MKFKIKSGSRVTRYHVDWSMSESNNSPELHEVCHTHNDVCFSEWDLTDDKRKALNQITPEGWLLFVLPKKCLPWLMLEIQRQDVEIIPNE